MVRERDARADVCSPHLMGREAHTTADADTGCIINYEIYEGKTLMADKNMSENIVEVLLQL